MLFLVTANPMRFRAVCDDCNAREGPIEGTRAVALEHLRRMAWRVDESARNVRCADCAGPPSVFPATRIVDVEDGLQCNTCGLRVERCSACNMPFRGGDVVSCRRDAGHCHPRCSTQKLPKFVPPDPR